MHKDKEVQSSWGGDETTVPEMESDDRCAILQMFLMPLNWTLNGQNGTFYVYFSTIKDICMSTLHRVKCHTYVRNHYYRH